MLFCGSKNVVRNGLRGRTQRYKCKDCGRRFDGGIRRDKSQVITDYVEGIEWLKSQGFRIYGVVIDGMKGLPQALRTIRVQMCQFHQMLILRRYITQDPDIEASAELLKLVNNITKMDKESFVGAFEEWYEKYKDIVNERVQDKRIKHKTPPYMRPRLRSAYRNVRRNMPLLWTFYDHPETGPPNTNNALEGLFSDLKSKVRVHSGIIKEHRKNCWMNISKDRPRA